MIVSDSYICGRQQLWFDCSHLESVVQLGEPLCCQLAILRLHTQYEKHKGILESYFLAGGLDFEGWEKEHIFDVVSQVCAVAAQSAVTSMANFGANDKAAVEVIFGQHTARGKLPFELPAQWKSCEDKKKMCRITLRIHLTHLEYGLTY